MHDIRAIREDPEAFTAALTRRGLADAQALTADILDRDHGLRALLTRLQQAQARRNEASKLIGKAKAQKDEAGAQSLMAEVAGLKDEIQKGEAEERGLQEELRSILAAIPNLPADDVPVGPDESANVEVKARAFGSRPAMNAAKEHFELGEALGLMDFERAAKVSGSRFVYLKAGLARLERALGNFMLDLHTDHFGYTEMQTPILARESAFFGTGQMPKFEMEQFWAVSGELLSDGSDADVVATLRNNRYGLIPTAEVPLTNYVSGEILDEAQLPFRVTAWTPCFRSEAGAAGKDTRGMIRHHQFWKVELISVTTPEQSNDEHERMTDCAQEVLKRLGLHHRVVTLCTGDMGFSAQKTYDIEVWLPGQGRFREISSCSNCGEFQARRMNTRYRGADGKVKGFVHTLNGSGLAVGRTLIAVMENYQEADGSIRVPDVLQPYMGGVKTIGG
ncbi:MAG: serine--tRNA ligase [Alphaproteobacteria bacterium]|nr:serine--tRNA ligase [Alphaproteobacteria bacterium]